MLPLAEESAFGRVFFPKADAKIRRLFHSRKSLRKKVEKLLTLNNC
jgi:hypothetical protein